MDLQQERQVLKRHFHIMSRYCRLKQNDDSEDALRIINNLTYCMIDIYKALSKEQTEETEPQSKSEKRW